MSGPQRNTLYSEELLRIDYANEKEFISGSESLTRRGRAMPARSVFLLGAVYRFGRGGGVGSVLGMYCRCLVSGLGNIVTLPDRREVVKAFTP